MAERSRPDGCRKSRRAGFSLLEVLVCVAVIALLIAILVPSLRAARMRARITVAHADLRQITVAISAYSLYNRDRLPPTYASCMDKQATYALPAELWKGKYLRRKDGDPDLAYFPDAFDGRRSYKYRATEPIVMNGSLTRQYSRIWVPDAFPSCGGEAGEWFPKCKDPAQDYGGRIDRCRGGVLWGPVRYAVWSEGPDPDSPKFPRSNDGLVMEGTFPLPRALWLRNEADTGLITHFQARNSLIFTSW